MQTMASKNQITSSITQTKPVVKRMDIKSSIKVKMAVGDQF